jgi:hypothetical protein
MRGFKHFSRRSKLSILISVAGILVLATGFMIAGFGSHTSNAHADTYESAHINCQFSALCSEVANAQDVFGNDYYVGHDEPADLFYSNAPGSGNQMRYQLTLPKDPSASNPEERGKSYEFQLNATFWFGMAMCATMSYPELLNKCTPDSDSNIVDPAISPRHPGTAFMEMQFYPPGWAPFELPGGISCDATQWCAALTIDSLAENPVDSTLLNPTCAAKVGTEYVNFAFLTKSGHPQPDSPPNPVNATSDTFTPNPSADLFMSSGDKLNLTMHDTAHGLQVVVNDLSSGESGSMTASAANGFGQVLYAPTGTTCENVPYDFHPMYSTSSEKTRVTWAAHSYNIAFTEEIGHWDFCTHIDPKTSSCNGLEGIPGDREPADSDDTFCLPGSVSLRIPLTGCAGANAPGFDGPSYQPLWPDGNTTLRPTPVRVSSPVTGSDYSVQYNRFAFEVDTPRIERSDFGGTCDAFTGANCPLIPETDDGEPATFYPFYSIANRDGSCVWMFGNHIPGSITDFGQNNQDGDILALTYTAFDSHSPETLYEDYRQIYSHNPCPAAV